MWTKVNDNYSIHKDTCTVKSHARKHLFGLTVKNVPERILVTSKQGYVNINGKSTNVKKLYKEVYGIDWEE